MRRLSNRPAVRTVCAIALCLTLGRGAASQTARRPQPTETEVKAAFLYHFAQLVTWPESPDADPTAPIVIGVVGADPFGPRLEATIADQLVRGRRIRIVRASSVEELGPAHIVFFGARDRSELSRGIGALGRSPVLTVSSSPGFARSGGMIEFRITADQRVAFDINVPAANAAGLRMSAQLLKIARLVEPEK